MDFEALSVDQAVERLLTLEAPPVADPASAQGAPDNTAVPDAAGSATETPAQDAPADGDGGGQSQSASAPSDEATDAPGDPAGEGGMAANPEPARPAVQAPHFWDEPARARFAELPSEIQSIVLDQWKNGERANNAALEKAAEARKAAETKAAELDPFLGRLKEVVPKAEAAFKSKWENVDWVRWAQDDPAQYAIGKELFAQEQAEVQRLQDARREAEQREQQAQEEAHKAFIEAERVKLAELAPALVDPKEGPARLRALDGYLRSAGATDADLRNIDARILSIAHKAMLYDEAQAKAAQAARTTPKTPPPPARAPVRPATGSGASRTTPAAAALSRLAQTGRAEDAVELLLSRQKG